MMPPFPEKTRELKSVLFDSEIWNDFAFRDGDIIVATWSKSGTTLTQQIVLQLLFQGDPDKMASGNDPLLTPWLDMRLMPRDEMLAALEAQQHRRVIKTHLPVDALRFSSKARYLYVGRDARDIIWSMYNHHAGYSDSLLDAFNNTLGREGPGIERVSSDVRDYYLHWVEHDELPNHPLPSLWDHVLGWWNVRRLPNVMLVHFANLIRDLEGEVRRIAAFLHIAVEEARFPAILANCSIDRMRAAAENKEHMRIAFKEGAATFFNKGTNGRWRDVLSAEEAARCDEVASKRLPTDCAHWLCTGQLPPGEARGGSAMDIVGIG